MTAKYLWAEFNSLILVLVGNISVALKLVFTGSYECSFRFVRAKCVFIRLEHLPKTFSVKGAPSSPGGSLFSCAKLAKPLRIHRPWDLHSITKTFLLLWHVSILDFLIKKLTFDCEQDRLFSKLPTDFL